MSTLECLMLALAVVCGTAGVLCLLVARTLDEWEGGE